ncbi:kinase-like domain-containing protein [Circinella umbellata]|nr:kinase-like domain-containing protein [Circinella umbellata]
MTVINLKGMQSSLTSREKTPSYQSNSKKRANSQKNEEPRKMVKPFTCSNQQQQQQQYICRVDFRTHYNAWGYLEATVPENPSGYLWRQSYKSASRTGYLIGSSQHCDFTYNHSKIEKRHCLIYMETWDDVNQQTNKVYVHNFSFQGTYVNSNLIPVNKRKQVESGDCISFTGDEGGPAFKIILPARFKVNSIHDEYDNGRTLGSGGFGSVVHAFKKTTTKEFAIKRINKTYRSCYFSAINEIGLMMAIDPHPCIMQIGKVFEDRNHIYLSLEYVAGGDLCDYLALCTKLNERQTRFVFHQLFNAVDFLHDQQIVHRDLKPENVLLVDYETLHVKIGDFGLSTMKHENLPLSSNCGTRFYKAPELKNNIYGKEVDLWSSGVILYVCLSGRLPFLGTVDDIETTCKFDEQEWVNIRSEAKNLICQLLTVNPKMRITAKSAQEHHWMQLDVEDLIKRNKKVMMRQGGEKKMERIFSDVVNKKFVHQKYRNKTANW